jgi:hypothetical protein
MSVFTAPTNKMGGGLRNNATVYVGLLTLALLIAGARELRVQSIFACPASGYGTDRYLAHCAVDHYGDYDDGAVWYSLEPGIGPNVRSAQVIFMGDSHLQWAFSSAATANWFASAHARYYLFGFAYWETYLFEERLLRRFAPKPRAFVINLEGFFLSSPSPPAQLVMYGGDDVLRRYRDKQFQQWLHKTLCTRLSGLCGDGFAYFRSRVTGGWVRGTDVLNEVPVSDSDAIDEASVAQQEEAALQFVSRLPVHRDCIILTMVPTVGTKYAAAAAIAARLQLPFIAPQISGLGTFDGTHLDTASAQRWSEAFFQVAGPHLQQCLQQSPTTETQLTTQTAPIDRTGPATP